MLNTMLMIYFVNVLGETQIDCHFHFLMLVLTLIHTRLKLRSSLSKGVMLADEVGLGKTIEAGLVLCQHWAERKRRLLVICPASLRSQWAQEFEHPKTGIPYVHWPESILQNKSLSATMGKITGNDAEDESSPRIRSNRTGR